MWSIIVKPTTVNPGVAAFGLGVWKVPITVEDPGGPAGTGLVMLRGSIKFQPGHAWDPGPRKLFNLPQGMRPKDMLWFTCVELLLIGPPMPPTQHTTVRVLPNGDVELLGGGSEDPTFFFDGINFLAQQ